MRILHLISGGDGGAASGRVLSLLAGLKTTEDVRLACLSDGSLAGEARARGIPVLVLQGSRSAAVKQLTKTVQTEGVELLHCHDLNASRVGCLVGKRAAVPTVSTVYSQPEFDCGGGLLAALKRESRELRALRRVDFRICAAQAVADALHEHGFDPNRSFVLADDDPAKQKEIYDTVLRRTARAAARGRDGVLICGAFGKGNSGDNAILQAMVQTIRDLDPDMPIYATTRSAGKTAREAEVGAVHTFCLWRIRGRMKKTALYLSGGGSLIQDVTSNRSLWYYLYSIRMAKRCGNHVMMFGCGIGPVRRKANRRLAAHVIQKYVDRITLRDNASARELERMGIHGVPTRVTADMAFLVRPASEERVEQFCADCCVQGRIDLSERMLILAPRPWEGTDRHLADFAAAARHAARTYGLRPVLLAIEPKKDRGVCERIAALAQEQGGIQCPVLEAPKDASAVVGLLRRVDAVLGMRLHALIFAAAQGTPFAGVSYDPKVAGFVEYIGQGHCCSLEQVSAERLCAMVDGLMQASREEFRASARRLRALASENCEEALGLIQ